MKQLEPEEFPQVNVHIAENQEEFLTLPAHVTEDARVVCCFHVTPEQMADMARTGQLWIQIFTQNGTIQPFSLHTGSPFPTDEQITES